MSANTALIFDFNEERARAGRESDRVRLSMSDAQNRIARCGRWLESTQLCVLGFVYSTLSDPVIIVAAHPDAWRLFAGRAENTGHDFKGALRYEVWEGFDRINKVRVRWQEVVACA